LHEEKNCNVDIVEIDSESGGQAKAYARKSCIGTIEGDLEREEWKKILTEEPQYDYVIILDVLEHVRNSEQVLANVSKMLKDNGEIILSVPNIAHNSVLINLLNNKFDYTQVGLLDNTHVRFFAQNSLEKMISECGLYVYQRNYKQMLVGENEILNRYEDIPTNVSNYLRMREGADIYQFLYQIGKKENTEQIVMPKSLDYTLFPMEIYNDRNKLEKKFYINPINPVKVLIDVDEYSDIYRVDPIDQRGLASDLKIYLIKDGIKREAKILKSNGVYISEKIIAFIDDDPQIYIANEIESKNIEISFSYTIINEKSLDFLVDKVYRINDLQRELDAKIEELNSIKDEIL
jgi:SAM-dependent methyltransferase